MAALTAGVIMLGLLALLELSMRHQRARETQRHVWRLELQQSRLAVAKAEDVKQLEERIRRLEMKGVTR